MSHLAFERVVVRRPGRILGPITATFGPGVHAIAAENLADLDALVLRLAIRRSGFEGTLRLDDDRGAVVMYLGDLLPWPSGHRAGNLARCLAGHQGGPALARAGIAAHRRTEDFAAPEAFALAAALIGSMPHVGAVLVPPPHTLVGAHDEAEAARALRRLAAAGVPVVVFLPRGAPPARWAEDVLRIDATGAASAPECASTLDVGHTALRVRGTGLEQLAPALALPGVEVALDDAGRELVVRSRHGLTLERALTDAIAGGAACIDEVIPCA